MRYICFLILFVLSSSAFGNEVLNIGVASNFYEPIKIIKDKFEKKNKVDLNIISGSSAQIYAQIVNGAPIDIFLSADQKTPKKLNNKLKVKNSQFTYAIGKLIFWSAIKNINEENAEDFFKKTKIKYLVIANPKFSPYGQASKEFLVKTGLWFEYQNKLIMANNISQVASFLYSGNVKNGIMSYSDKIKFRNNYNGKFLNISQTSFSNLKQDAILLSRGIKNKYSKFFLTFLKSKSIKGIIQSFGYKVED